MLNFHFFIINKKLLNDDLQNIIFIIINVVRRNSSNDIIKSEKI